MLLSKQGKTKLQSSLQGLSFPAIRTQQKTVREPGPRPECRSRQSPPSSSIIRAGACCSCRRRAGHRLYKPPRQRELVPTGSKIPFSAFAPPFGILSFAEFTIAFTRYTEVICAAFPHRRRFSHGFHPGVESLPSQSLICPNLQSALAEPETVDSPIGVATRKFLGKKRLIIDLSSPHNSQFPSINSLILLEEFSLHYHDIDQAITLIKDADYVPAARLLTTQKLFSELGIPLAQDKTEGPRTSIKFLGINLEKFLASLPKEKIDRTVLVASTLLTNSSCSKRELLFILGHLNFVIRIIPQGRPFISHLLSLASSADALEDHISLTDSCRNELSLTAYLSSTAT
ncbi:reverse transcriptase ribonuclease [Labeo rohita]|uniref:Reverse transcriptase ribonuclease n=1 Tax=Labeo rohita TaxID=84645 RepID=A0A498NRL4_LABRO|nr:reverse transcriptase ribonuclease [Labeo rohita]